MTSEFKEEIKDSVTKSLTDQYLYDTTMKKLAWLIFDIFMLITYVDISMSLHNSDHNIGASIIMLVIGGALVISTWITLSKNQQNANEMAEHGRAILASPCQSVKDDLDNISQYFSVAERYNEGRKSVFVMNFTSMIYMVLLAILICII